jgi:hypothetical protein
MCGSEEKSRVRSEMQDCDQPAGTRASATAHGRHFTTRPLDNASRPLDTIALSLHPVQQPRIHRRSVTRYRPNIKLAERSATHHNIHCSTQHSPQHSDHPQYPSTARDSPSRDDVATTIHEHSLLGAEPVTAQQPSAISLARHTPCH